MDYLIYALIAVAAFCGLVFLCHLPILPIWRVYKLNLPERSKIVKCFLGAWLRNALVFVPDMLAPIVVPIALVFTRWEAEHLPRLFRWWDNDASINGDRRTDDANDGFGGWAIKPVPLERDSAEALAMCYYAPGHHPRSFYARWVWLGLRNRASSLSQSLGYEQQGTDRIYTVYSDEANKAKIVQVGGVYRYYEEVPLGGDTYIRLHYGYKVPVIPSETHAPVVAIGFSLRKRKPAE